MTKKLMALLLAVLMAVSLLPMPALADGSATVITDISKITEAGSYIPVSYTHLTLPTTKVV